MPSYNFTIDDASPSVAYEGVWTDSNSTYSGISGYANGTFHASNATDASASFTFNGTGVYLFGAKSTDRGSYQVTLDGQATTPDGFASPSDSQTLLFRTGELEYGLHTVTLSNTGAPLFANLDYAVITTGDGMTSTEAVETTLDDTSCEFEFSSGWDDSSNSFTSEYFNSTMHRTDVMDARVQIHFQGSAISLFGATSLNHGLFSVSLDGAKSVIVNGSAPQFRPQTLLYHFDGLPHANHTVTLQNLGMGEDNFLDVDYAVVLSYASALNTMDANAMNANAINASAWNATAWNATAWNATAWSAIASNATMSNVTASSSNPRLPEPTLSDASSASSINTTKNAGNISRRPGLLVLIIGAALVVVGLLAVCLFLLVRWRFRRHYREVKRRTRRARGQKVDVEACLPPPTANPFASPPPLKPPVDDPFSDPSATGKYEDILPSYDYAIGTSSKDSSYNASGDRKLAVITESEPTSPVRSSDPV